MMVPPHHKILTEIAETPEGGKTGEQGRSHAHAMNPSDDATHDPGLNLLRRGRSPVRRPCLSGITSQGISEKGPECQSNPVQTLREKGI